MRQGIKILLCFSAALFFALAPCAQCLAEAPDTGDGDSSTESFEGSRCLALGEDLKDSEKSKVLDYFDIPKDADINSMYVVYVSNEEEHEYLDKYIGEEKTGTRALSSAYIEIMEPGFGIEVETHNIGFCSPGMYENALKTAGLSDAKVVVAGPFELSGTAALIGVVKAYALMTGTEMDVEALDAALNELVVTGEMEQEYADADSATIEEFINYVKDRYMEEKPADDEAIRQLITDAAAQYGLKLSDDFIERLIEVLKKITFTEITFDMFHEPIGKAATHEASDKPVEAGSENTNWFMQIINAIIEFFKNLFGGL